jgi:hypothetical protein
MALSDLAVFSEYAYKAKTEVLRQKIDLFNAATAGALVLKPAAHQGDFSDTAFWAKINGGTTRRRNVYGSGTIAQKTLKHLVDTSVKVAAGTFEFVFDEAWLTWIQRSPKEAGATFGQQMAVDSMADMLNTGIGLTVAAMAQTTEIVTDVTGETGDAARYSFRNQNKAVSKFGDAGSQVGVWLSHSTPMYDLFDQNLTNAERLFTFGNLNVIRDPFGRLMVMTDSPHLYNSGTAVATSLGLTQGALYVGENNDFNANEETRNGNENIQTSYQAEWTYNVGVKGYAWDKANGGKSPTDAALFTSTNWDRYATSQKDLAGVILKTK